MARLFNVQCALHDPNCHAHARYLFESVEESTTSNSVLIKGMQIFNSPQSGTKGENIDSSAGKINEINP
ncbi:hypothetical protein T12_5339 [Trichinella patagoniensis]|uniref:Uncharacterized protein n=1 Tax=Trichinella patagoniensis TaxID=990121 RepID=A0A0V0Z2R5_9BILA|nr:hypothetical protein T12_5339 [Trichinella patagoniensis]